MPCWQQLDELSGLTCDELGLTTWSNVNFFGSGLLCIVTVFLLGSRLRHILPSISESFSSGGRTRNRTLMESPSLKNKMGSQKCTSLIFPIFNSIFSFIMYSILCVPSNNTGSTTLFTLQNSSEGGQIEWHLKERSPKLLIMDTYPRCPNEDSGTDKGLSEMMKLWTECIPINTSC